jgi:hypothetical protein
MKQKMWSRSSVKWWPFATVGHGSETEVEKNKHFNIIKVAKMKFLASAKIKKWGY